MNKITMIALSTLIAAGPMIKADPAKEKKPLEFVPRPQTSYIFATLLSPLNDM
jgi:hypothetical protein